MSNQTKNLVNSLTLLTLVASLTSCGGGTETAQTGTTEGGSTPTATANKPEFASNVSLNGAGASFPAPLYQAWFVQLNQEIPNLQVNYQSTGSGAGVEQFTQGTIDFGASDVAIKPKEAAKVKSGVLALPMTAGSIVIGYNLPGVDKLQLSQEAYTGIFAGTITKWNDPKIVKDNPDAKLPDLPITVVHRSDGSGTTAVFTKHLATISPEWKKDFGEGKSIEWPTKKGKFLGAKGNEGVTATLQQNQGSVGYVEYGYAKNNKVTFAALQNKAGKFVEATDASAAAALASEPLPSDLILFISNPPGDDAYPIVTYTWMLVNKKYDDPNKAKGIEAMIQFGLTTGQKQSSALGYVPLPPEVVKKVAAAADVISPDFQIKVD
ncbi:MAG: Phosphate-binding protein PstS [Chroococcopsis gigantea SAG 12.99]|jgi:phosphate transport system substrate-binding protein|nr:phosphate ABC transporter substrate-binding protein PstS [Chlorogloea purpurea SAG 13.99]MDV2999046.1 Phosphate-binding protein PstS [Chroococcopsis gigantea SAG 12.99]